MESTISLSLNKSKILIVFSHLFDFIAGFVLLQNVYASKCTNGGSQATDFRKGFSYNHALFLNACNLVPPVQLKGYFWLC